ncbi:zf-HC2 domain-containing protein [Jatrophihabitans sp. YIM 134969]
MRCEEYRDAASATLDGEPAGAPAATLDEHRVTCADCRAWQRDVELITRRARLREADGAPADLADRVLAAVARPALRSHRRVTVLRWLLAVVGVAQLAVAVPSLFHDDLGMSMSAHASHEAGAWNLAVAAALLLVAARPARVGGALAAIGTFVVALAALSVADLLDGGVGLERLTTHAAVAVGAVLLLALHRATKRPPGRVPVDPAVADPAQESSALRTWSARLDRRPRDVA